MSSTNRAVFEREQQGVNWSLAACSSGVRYKSLWSGTPSITRVRQVPHTPCSHDTCTSTPASDSACTTVLSLGMTINLPELAIYTSKLASLAEGAAVPAKNS